MVASESAREVPRESTLTVHWGRELLRLPWGTTEELSFSGRFLCGLASSDLRTYIRNAHATEVGAVLLNGEVALPLTRPSGARCRGDGLRSYTSSAYAHYVDLAADEQSIYGETARQKIARRGKATAILLSVPLSCATLLLRTMTCVWGLLAKWCELDLCVYVNNWLLSTTLPPAGAPVYHVAGLTRLLTREMPCHTLAYRCVDARTQPALLTALVASGWSIVPARYVHFQEPEDPALWKRQAVKHDLRLAARRLKNTCDEGNKGRGSKANRRIGGSGQVGGDSKSGTLEWRLLHKDDSFATFARCAQLYELLYVDRYSAGNPQFTPEFIAFAIRERVLTLLVLEDRAANTIDGVLGYYVRGGFLTTPLFGYDTHQPSEAGLYRLLSLKVLQEGYRLGVTVHASGGAGGFKRQRGATSTVEYMAVYTAHLPWRRRFAWYILGLFLNPVARLAKQDAVQSAKSKEA